ncbi:two-component sensor histidine kinase [Bacillus pseudomycoides]|uniref:histidine kinase n=1 Tax=Bacillus pseudomycoides TaxID=64104 RepID=A0AA91VA16_9BACI|nr:MULTISPECIES: HAMP domain-containing sensor histidine kinase [Bacillus]PEB47446.1 two-component sensor histidine kinase [Bacillus sp. AFS098217]PED80675.1 two-component sensor histidine kinase [Bacillus pseudomycoides]PEU10369.1 two-component sensor histidine kinase [Bacillus sp. AFS014408]PEU13333.1 two-component sensor histidine kinase [Bacillus sp. AFS019443]PFW62922.1 two-component sensor histidine kinase [Bacillus sp. AFS075034]
MATKSTRKKENITKNIFIKTMLFCILLLFCLYQIMYFLLSNYDKKQQGHSINAEEVQKTENEPSSSKNAESKSEQNKAFSGNLSQLPPSSIDVQTLYTTLSHILQKNNQAAKAKENVHAQSPSDKQNKNESLTQPEKQSDKNVASDVTDAKNKSSDDANLTDALKQLAPHIAITMLTISLLGSLIYTKLIAKPFQYMSDALKEIMNLDFSDKPQVKTSAKKDNYDLQAITSQAQHIVKNLHETNKDLRSELRKEQELEKSRKEFMSMLSHELKTPIAAVMGQLDGMIHGIGAYKDRDKYLKRSYEMMQDINILTEKMSELSKIQNPQFTPTLEIIPLSTIIEDVMKKVDYFVNVKQLKIQSNIKQDVQILADHKFIQTAIFNIISNAVHYTIDHQHVYIKLYEKPNSYALEVLNTGTQIDEEKLAHLFEPFYRANPGKHGLVQGSGLGLYIVKQILDKHQFPYGIQNTPQGVKCSIIFPKAL